MTLILFYEEVVLMIREPEDYAVEYTLRALRGVTFKSLQLILNQLTGQNRIGGMVSDKQMAKTTQARDFIDFDKRLLDTKMNERIFKQELKRFGVQASITEMANGDTKLQFFSKDREALIHAVENITDRIYQQDPALINYLYPDYEKNKGIQQEAVQEQSKEAQTNDTKEVQTKTQSQTVVQEKVITKSAEQQSFTNKVVQSAEKKQNPVRQEIEKAKEILQKEKAEKAQSEHKKEHTGPERTEKGGR